MSQKMCGMCQLKEENASTLLWKDKWKFENLSITLPGFVNIAHKSHMLPWLLGLGEIAKYPLLCNDHH
jgi:hypothetical protein